MTACVLLISGKRALIERPYNTTCFLCKDDESWSLFLARHLRFHSKKNIVVLTLSPI